MFDKLRSGISTAIEKITTKTLTEKNLDDALWDLQLVLIQNDVAVEVAEAITSKVKEKLLGYKTGRLEKVSKIVRQTLYESILEILMPEKEIDLVELVKTNKEKGNTTVILLVGINGTGKTTTLAKLAYKFKKEKLSVVIAAGDTFRAGSIEQLEKHAKKLGVKIIKHEYKSDSAAVAYDAINHAKARHLDVVLIDSAGRMQVNKNLMDEMKKIVRVAAPDLKIFIGDALAGNDALSQATEFNNAIGIDGTILTKVDADPNGGAALSIAYITKKPILYVGVGQEYKDLEKFDPKWFASRITGYSQ